MTAPSGVVVALGEVLLRLAPTGRRLMRQAASFDVEVGGAEANVLAALTGLGHRTRLVSALPDSPLGQLAVAQIAARGIATDQVRIGSGRMGLYFLEQGQGRRPSRIVYDRADSSFATAKATDFSADAVLADATLLHLSGITPALGDGPTDLALALARQANLRGIPVCFDGNFRAQLWASRGVDPTPVLTELIGCADVLIGNHQDIALVTGADFKGEGEDRRAAAVARALAEFPRLALIASTARHVVDSDRHLLSARVDSRHGGAQTEEIAVEGIIDRIGTGDAFAAGVLDSWLRGEGVAAAARAGLALAALKHGVPGDACHFTRSEVAAFWGEGRDVQR